MAGMFRKSSNLLIATGVPSGPVRPAAARQKPAECSQTRRDTGRLTVGAADDIVSPMSVVVPDPNIVALGIKQPWAELILRGAKTLEVRTVNTRVRGTIYLYASKRPAASSVAQSAADAQGIDVAKLPCGVLVGSVELQETRVAGAGERPAACLPAEMLERRFVWRLRNPQRFAKPVPVRFLPYGVWFYPFRRRNGAVD
jgi:hypothetical protein